MLAILSLPCLLRSRVELQYWHRKALKLNRPIKILRGFSAYTDRQRIWIKSTRKPVILYFHCHGFAPIWQIAHLLLNLIRHSHSPPQYPQVHPKTLPLAHCSLCFSYRLSPVSNSQALKKQPCILSSICWWHWAVYWYKQFNEQDPLTWMQESGFNRSNLMS